MCKFLAIHRMLSIATLFRLVSAIVCLSASLVASARDEDLSELVNLIEVQDARIMRQAEQLEELRKQVLQLQVTLEDEVPSLRSRSTSSSTDSNNATSTPTEKGVAPSESTFFGKKIAPILSLSASINRGLLHYNDGIGRENRHVDNENNPTRFRLDGASHQNADATVGGAIEIHITSNNTEEISQQSTGDNLGPDVGTSRLRIMEAYLDSKRFGRLTIGEGKPASDETSEVDLSGTATVAHSSVQKLGASLEFVQTTGTLSGIKIGQVFNAMDGLSGDDRIRYDTPDLNGVRLSASVLDGGAYDIAARYDHAFGNAVVKIAISHVDKTSAKTSVQHQSSGSVSLLHANGLNLTLAGGKRRVADTATRYKAWFAYGKLGYKASIFPIGETAFAADYGKYDSIRVLGEVGETWGIQVLQKLSNSNLQLYAGYRNFSVDSRDITLLDIDTAIAGVLVTF